MDDDIRESIARLEERIETLRLAIERCRKISLASKITIVLGAAWTVLTIAHAVSFVPSTFFAALAAIIGGFVLLGSNKTTWEQTNDAMQQTEAERNKLISQVEMRLVAKNVTLH